MPSVRYFQNHDTEKQKISLLPVIIGWIGAALFAVAAIVLFALLFLYTNIPQSAIPFVAKAVLFFSVFFGGLLSGKSSRNNGWMFGALTGTGFAALLILIGFVMGIRENVALSSIFSAVLCAVIGAVGGVTGINMRSKSKSKAKH